MSNSTAIPFNKVWFTGDEGKYIQECIAGNKTCGNGRFTKIVSGLFRTYFRSEKMSDDHFMHRRA